jgi:hypothetical protein
MIIDCEKCSKCRFPGCEWFPIVSLRFCRLQMIFLIQHIAILRQGEYPPCPDPSNYVRVSMGQINFHAPYEQNVQIASEVDSRLDKLPGITRKLLETEIEYYDDMSDWSSYSRQAINYVSGWRRRRTSFIDFKKQDKRKSRMTLTSDKDKG